MSRGHTPCPQLERACLLLLAPVAAAAAGATSFLSTELQISRAGICCRPLAVLFHSSLSVRSSQSIVCRPSSLPDA